MVFRNAKNILKHCSPFNSYKLLLASAQITRPRYRPLCQVLLRPFVRDGQLIFRYRCYEREMRGSLRLSELSSDLLSAWELSVSDTYEIDEHFEPDLVVDAGGNIGLFTLRMAAAATSAGQQDVKYVIVEPLPQNVVQIEKHLKMNGIDAEIMPTCLGGSRRSIPFYCREAIKSSFDPKEPYEAIIDLQVLSLKDITGPSLGDSSKRILIKLDIEGMELEALQSYIPEERRPVYIVGELHDFEGQSALLEGLFQEHGWTSQFYEIADNYAHFRACSPLALPMLPSLAQVAASGTRAA